MVLHTIQNSCSYTHIIRELDSHRLPLTRHAAHFPATFNIRRHYAICAYVVCLHRHALCQHTPTATAASAIRREALEIVYEREAKAAVAVVPFPAAILACVKPVACEPSWFVEREEGGGTLLPSWHGRSCTTAAVACKPPHCALRSEQMVYGSAWSVSLFSAGRRVEIATKSCVCTKYPVPRQTALLSPTWKGPTGHPSRDS